MGWLTNLSVGKKIMGGFGVMATLIAIVVVLTAISIKDNEEINNRVFSLRLPTVLNTVKAVDGINYSLAALRGWMILGKDTFKTQRADAWRQIRQSEAKMTEYSKHWTNAENVRRFEEIQGRLNAFEAAQNEVEAMAWTVDELPATKMLTQKAAPRAAIIIKNITKMIDIEANQPATAERKRLLGMMADVRGSMGLALANIRAYLLTGDKKFVTKFNGFWATNDKRFGDLSRQTKLFTPGQRSAFNSLKTARAEFAPLPPKMFEIRGSNKWNMANYLLGAKAAPEASNLLEALRAMEVNQEGLAAIDVAKAEDAATQLLSSVSLLGVIAMIIAVVISILISRMITVPVNKALDAMRDIAEGEGDLTRRLDESGKDEISQMSKAFNKFAIKIQDVVSQVKQSAESLSSGSQQISAGNANLSQRTEEQASSLEETASSMEEMTSTVQQNAESAQEANLLAATAQQQAVKGGEVVHKTITAMEEINSSSAKIADIISTIDGIAFQTNLLALNAAVEAARAGEQGRGFAVVASEVRTLAQRSADAAKEIKTLIEDSVSKVKAGSALVDESGKTLADINADIDKVANIVGEIASASREQSAGIEQVNTAITQMDDMTQQNAALVEEAAAASRSMQNQASNMIELMSYFKVEEQGSIGMTQQAKAPETPVTPAKPKPIKRTGTDNKDWENF